ncbi:MAG: sulfite exporter TauE/SafE family protein [Acidobacteriota bacterium]
MSAFLFGLLGGAHCASMCGGIVAVLGARHRIIPIQALDGRGAAVLPPSRLQPLAYNIGRVASYGVAGAIVGGLGSTAWLAQHVLPVQHTAFVAANLVMVVLGLALVLGAGRLAPLERFGAAAWKRLAPRAARVLRAPGARGALAAGLIWGWVPCGMVYGVLVAALVSGSAANGALLLLAFGLGTLPNLLLLGWLVQRGAGWLGRQRIRFAAGVLIIVFGVAGIARTDPLARLHDVIDVCLQPWR